MKPFRCIIFTLIFSGVFLSCEKEPRLIVENTDIPLISKILYNESQLSSEYSYNDANLVSEEKSKYFFIKHTYNRSNQLTLTEVYFDERLASNDWQTSQDAYNRTEWVNPENTPCTAYQNFNYNDRDQMISANLSRHDSPAEYSELSYDERGRIYRQTYFWDNAISVYIDYEYDEKGNVMKTSRYIVYITGEAILSSTNEYQFDNNPNPFKAFRRLVIPGINTNENNITKETYTEYSEADHSVVNTRTTETSYEYNDSGYPVKKGGSTVYQYK